MSSVIAGDPGSAATRRSSSGTVAGSTPARIATAGSVTPDRLASVHGRLL